ncbi:OTU protein [Coemansia sp. RSA 2611]|nr:OTU protein [Coemansia sp. RSA 2611]
MSTRLETTLEELQARHRRENKELVARVTTLKRAVPKGDKRKKKEATAEIAELEKQHEERHKAELSQFSSTSAQASGSEPAGEMGAGDALAAAGNGDDTEPTAVSTGGLYDFTGSARKPTGKKNKAKLRQQRKAEELQRMQDEAELEAEDMVDLAAVETEAIEKLVAGHGMRIEQIRPDGHCLYSAFADQIGTYHGQSASYAQMRQRAAEYMRSHCDDFIPFMVHDSGDMFSEEDFERYCDDIETTATWGGQQEITALAHALQLPVHVYQSGVPVLRIGEDAYAAKDPINLSYHRHAYGLGEHYNSLRKL